MSLLFFFTMPRKDSDSYWFKFYPDKYLGGTAGFSLEMHGAYLILLLYQWEDGFITEERAIAVCGDSWNKIKHKFVFTEIGYVNTRMDEERNHKLEISQKRTIAIKERYKSMKNRQDKGRYKCSTSVLQTVSSSSSSSLSNSKRKEDNKKKKKHSFEDSPFFDYNQFKIELKDWDEVKIKKYYDAAVSYSGANGGKYLNWILAVKSWERKDSEKTNKIIPRIIL